MEAIQSISAFATEDFLESSGETQWHIHFKGRVQGVGFRPYVYQKAIALGLTGAVSNGLDGVHIWLEEKENQAREFFREILNNPPPLSVITASSFSPFSHHHSSGFHIILEAGESLPDLWITPDFAICNACRAELEDPVNRRYHYPFITCTQCGPRYSVMKALPFERHLTTMEPFDFCPACNHEYNNPANRRYFAQTMSCPLCGIQMEWRDANGDLLNAAQEDMIGSITTALQKGLIVAVKGIGGFLLLVDATHAEAIQRLRQRKHRPAKPFAIMYPNIESLLQDAALSKRQIDALTSLEAPIVLLPISKRIEESLAVEALAPGLDKLGIMLPYAPLLHLIAQSFNKPMVATSGNVSGAPVCFTNEQALTSLEGIADFFLLHHRGIVAPQDDSVLSIPDEGAPSILLRRSRGYAPACEAYRMQGGISVLATGALMKSSFTMAHHHRVYVSQYLGNTDSYEAQQAYKHTLNHMQQLLQCEPECILTDLHPQYFSHQLATQLSAENNIPLHTVPHHKAHFAAILGETGLVDSNKKILGIVWDGTGLGEDGNSWGGEFFCFENNSIQRLNHFEYFPYLLGDKMALEPRLSALSLLNVTQHEPDQLKKMFSQQEWNLYNKMLHGFSGNQTSSVGRLFDAAACLITGISKQSFEGEAAMRLEALANKWCRNNGLHFSTGYVPLERSECSLSGAATLQGVLQDLQSGYDPGYISAKFHYTLASITAAIAGQIDVEDICFSGGVFQNTLLVNMMTHHLSKKFKLHFHKHLSPNDENISFGQLVYYDRGMIGGNE